MDSNPNFSQESWLKLHNDLCDRNRIIAALRNEIEKLNRLRHISIEFIQSNFMVVSRLFNGLNEHLNIFENNIPQEPPNNNRNPESSEDEMGPNEYAKRPRYSVKTEE